MNVRQQLATALQGALGSAFTIVADTRDIARVDDQQRGIVQLVRTKITNGDRMHATVHEFDLWVVTPNLDSEGSGEADLDDVLDEVLEVIEGLDWLTWSEAVRETHPAGYHAYQFTVSTQTVTTKE